MKQRYWVAPACTSELHHGRGPQLSRNRRTVLGASPARRQCRSMRPRSLVAPNATQKARPENLVVAATAIAEASPFPRQRTKTPRECPGGRRGRPKRPGRRDQAGLAARKRRVGAVRGAVPAQNEPKSDRPRAKTPMNRLKSRLRRRAAPCWRSRQNHYRKTIPNATSIGQ